MSKYETVRAALVDFMDGYNDHPEREADHMVEWLRERGFVVVPLEATEAMQNIGLYQTDGADPDFADIWQQMIARAPK